MNDIVNQGGFHQQYPELGNKPLAIDQVYTAEYYAEEKEKIFKKMWMRVAFACEIPNKGDYVVKEMECADTSLIVTHGADGKIRAFHNMCSHRSNRVAYDKSGNTKSFKCRFHAWTYGLDGALIYLPEPDLFPDFDQCDHGLTEVDCDVWEGFVFVNVNPDNTETLRERLGEKIWNGFDGYFEQFTRAVTLEVEVNCNWKPTLDAFSENYHFSTVHQLSAGNVMNSPDFPNGQVSALRIEGDHHMITVNASNVQQEPSFPEGIARKYSLGATLTPELAAELSWLPPEINPNRDSNWITEILNIFPCTNVQPLAGFVFNEDHWPSGHDKTRWVFTLLMREPKSAAEDVACEFMRALMFDVLREDLNNLEMIQSMLDSGAKKTQILGDQEVLIRHTYKAVADHVGYGYDK